MLYNAWIEVLKKARLDRGWSQEKAASKARVATSTWYRWEGGETYPNANQLECMARGVDLGEDELALLYCEAMVRHYRARTCSGEAEETGEAPEEELGELTARLEAASQEMEGESLRRLSTPSGTVWIELNDLMRTLAGHRSADARAARPKRPRPMVTPRAVRRRKKTRT